MKEESEIFEALKPPLADIGYELIEVTLRGPSGAQTLSIVVDAPRPISLEDIVMVSEKVSTLLDELDPIEDPYTLDVSSLGAEKPIKLERLDEYVGSYVNLHLSHPYKGENVLEGTLIAITEDTLTLRLRVKTKTVDVPLARNTIDKARLAIEF